MKQTQTKSAPILLIRAIRGSIDQRIRPEGSPGKPEELVAVERGELRPGQWPGHGRAKDIPPAARFFVCKAIVYGRKRQRLPIQLPAVNGRAARTPPATDWFNLRD